MNSQTSSASVRPEPRDKHFAWTILVAISMLISALLLCLFVMAGNAKALGAACLVPVVTVACARICTSQDSRSASQQVR
jgi:hypothetical protein